MSDELIKSVRENIDNAKENNFDFFGDPAYALMTDLQIAEDIVGCTGEHEDIDIQELADAVAVVRKERS